MAEITQASPGKCRRSLRRMPRVDMTAMVDVAFLLLTFFVLTTQMTRQQTMISLSLPVKSNGEIAASKMLHLIPGPHDSLHYYLGEDAGSLMKVPMKDLRAIVRAHVYNGRPLCADKGDAGCWDPIISIRPEKSAPYKALVETLDEMKISAVPKYALSEITRDDSLLIGLAATGQRVTER